MKHEARGFEITSPTKKTSLTYHLNKSFKFKYVKMWFQHLIAALTIFINVTLLRSCLPVLSEQVASQSKWQSTELDFLKLAKKRKSVWLALFRGNVRVSSLLNAGVDSKLGWKFTAWLKANRQKTRSPPLSENLNLERELLCLFWRVKVVTVSLHLTWAVNNLGSNCVL